MILLVTLGKYLAVSAVVEFKVDACGQILQLVILVSSEASIIYEQDSNWNFGRHGRCGAKIYSNARAPPVV
jgi:hypothetical protein